MSRFGRPRCRRACASRRRRASSPAASRCSAISAALLVGRFRLARFDRGGQPSVQPGAIGFQLRFVGHGANHRMPKRVFGTRGEPHLVDELGVDQLLDASARFPGWPADRCSNRNPITAAAASVCLAAGLSRSMRAAMVACSVGGTPISATSVRQV